MSFFIKVPFDEYLAFFKSEAAGSDYEHWIKIQYDYLKEPSWIGLGTYEIYAPGNFSIAKNSSFVIPTGFSYIGVPYNVICIPRFGKAELQKMTINDVEKHIVIRGTAMENHCFQDGDLLAKLLLED